MVVTSFFSEPYRYNSILFLVLIWKRSIFIFIFFILLGTARGYNPDDDGMKTNTSTVEKATMVGPIHAGIRF
jgi:hypothetical protein